MQQRILIIDDEPDITSVLKKGLEQNGFNVQVYNDPELLLTEYQPGSYDLLLVDIRMPKINGFELYRQIRKRDDRVKVCFLTAFEIYYDEFRKLFPHIDVKYFIRKPIGISNLVKQLNATLSN